MASPTTFGQSRGRLKLRISGAVQGVGFRYWTLDQAQQRNLTGYVRNERDGSVTVLLIGRDPSPAETWLRPGPSGSGNHNITLLPLAPEDQDWPSDVGFRITRC